MGRQHPGSQQFGYAALHLHGPGETASHIRFGQIAAGWSRRQSLSGRAYCDFFQQPFAFQAASLPNR